jgi:transcriptional antiterminator RfaH
MHLIDWFIMQHWYLIHTKPSGESMAESNLERQNYELYLPRIVQPVRRRGRWQEQIVPLFPRYLFLRLEEGRQSLAPVRSTLGVANVVRFGCNHAIVPDNVIRDLRKRADSETGFHRLNDMEFASGQFVRVAAGPFSGLEGIFQRRVGADRVTVLLSILGQVAPVRVPFDFLLPSRAT